MKLFKANSDKIHSILMEIKLTLAGLAVTNYAMDNHKLGFWLLLGAGLADILTSAFSSKEDVAKD